MIGAHDSQGSREDLSMKSVGLLSLIAGEGHKVSPAFFECRELVEFVLKQARPTKRNDRD
jgi:hypothetical protein